MSSSVNSVEDVCNLALAQIGYRRRIGSVWEGSAAARLALDVYAQTRDDLLRVKDWPFAQSNAVLVTNGQTPPPGWAFEWTAPADYLRLQYVVPSPITLPNLDPHPVRFREFFDPRVPARVILSSTSPATAYYIYQVTDMTQWDVGFVEAMVASLGRRFALSLGGDINLARNADGEKMAALESGIEADSAQAPLDSPITRGAVAQ